MGFSFIKFFILSVSTVHHAVARRITATLLLAALHLLVSFLYYLVLVLQGTGNSLSSKHPTFSHDFTTFPHVIVTVVPFADRRFLTGLVVPVRETVLHQLAFSLLNSFSSVCLSRLYTLFDWRSTYLCSDLMMLFVSF